MGTFILLVVTFLAIAIFVNDPFGRFARWANGKTQEELQAAFKDMSENDDALKKGCFGVSVFVFSILLSFVIEPIYVLGAISGEIGNRIVAYVVLVFVVAYWVRIFLGFRKGLSDSAKRKNVTVLTSDGQQVSGNIVDDPKRVVIQWNMSKPRYLLTKFFWGVPEFYLVYLLLVSLKLIAG